MSDDTEELPSEEKESSSDADPSLRETTKPLGDKQKDTERVEPEEFVTDVSP